MRLRSTYVSYLLAAALYLFLAVTMSASLLSDFGHRVPTASGTHLENDALLNLWVLAWESHALGSAPQQLFNGNTFFPQAGSIAFSEHQLGVMPIFVALWGLTGNPVKAFAALYVLSFVFTGLATFALARAWTGQVGAALFAGLAFAFTPPRLAHHFHTQLLSIWWMPLALLATERFLRRPTRFRGVIAAVCVTLQWYSSIYLGWLLTCALAIYLILAAWRADRPLARSGVWFIAIPCALGVALAILPTVLPYREVANRWAFQWPFSEVLSHSAGPMSFLRINDTNQLYALVSPAMAQSGGVEQQLYLGMIPLLLAVVGLGWSHIAHSSVTDTVPGTPWVVRITAVLIVLSVVLAFGPIAGGVPLPYLVLYDWVPGFQAMRNPSRFIFITALAVALLGAAGMTAILQRCRPGAPRLIVSFSIILVTALELFSRLPSAPIPQVDHDLVTYLASTEVPSGAVVHLPVTAGREVAETPRMFTAIDHWRPLVNGYSGFRPPAYQSLLDLLDAAPPETVALMMSELGISTLVLDLNLFTPKERARMQSAEWSQSGFRETLRTAQSAVWELDPSDKHPIHGILTAELRISNSISAGRTAPATLVLRSEEGTIYRDELNGVRDMTVTWESLSSDAPPLDQLQHVTLPLIVVPTPPAEVDLQLTTPLDPGRYRVHVSVNRLSTAREVTVTRQRTESPGERPR